MPAHWSRLRRVTWTRIVQVAIARLKSPGAHDAIFDAAFWAEPGVVMPYLTHVRVLVPPQASPKDEVLAGAARSGDGSPVGGARTKEREELHGVVPDRRNDRDQPTGVLRGLRGRSTRPSKRSSALRGFEKRVNLRAHEVATLASAIGDLANVLKAPKVEQPAREVAKSILTESPSKQVH